MGIITLLFIGMLTVLIFAAAIIKVTFCMLRIVFSLIFLPIILLPLIIVGVVLVPLAVIFGLLALPLLLPILLALFLLLFLPILLIKHLIA